MIISSASHQEEEEHQMEMLWSVQSSIRSRLWFQCWPSFSNGFRSVER